MLVQALYTMVLFELLPDLCYCFHNQESTVVWSWITCINPIYSLLKWASIIAMTYIASVYSLNPQNLSGFSPLLLFFFSLFFFFCFCFLFYTENLIIRECIYTENEIDITWLVLMVSSYSWLLMLAWDLALRAGFSPMAREQGDIIPWVFYCGFQLFEHWSAI